jgi:hypothetical protein
MHQLSTVTSTDAVKITYFVAKLLTLKCRKINNRKYTFAIARRILDLFWQFRLSLRQFKLDFILNTVFLIWTVTWSSYLRFDSWRDSKIFYYWVLDYKVLSRQHNISIYYFKQHDFSILTDAFASLASVWIRPCPQGNQGNILSNLKQINCVETNCLRNFLHIGMMTEQLNTLLTCIFYTNSCLHVMI